MALRKTLGYSVLVVVALLGLFSISSFSFLEKQSESIKPNVIIIYADDLGWTGLSSYGNKQIQTPNIDAIGTDGVRFTQAYATAPICSPSRMGLLTGRYQQRFGGEFLVPSERTVAPTDPAVTAFVISENNRINAFFEEGVDPNQFNKITKGIPLTEKLISNYFKDAGYATASIGKWHAGEVDGLQPHQRGFDYHYGFLSWGSIYASTADKNILTKSYHFHADLSKATKREGSLELVQNGKAIEESRYITDVFAEETVKFIEENKKKPFFIYVPFNAPHDPFQAKKSDFDKIATESDTTKRIYLAMIKSMDDAVGQIVAKLKKEGLDKNTIVVFGSDNGGASYTKQVSNAPLKGGKLSHFEGGIRVPLLIKYPTVIPAGKVYNAPVSNLDIFATVIAAAGINLPTDKLFDGVNLVPYVKSEKKNDPHPVLFWRNGYSKAVRKGDWKLYSNERAGRLLLYNLATDVSEKTDLVKSNPEKVLELQKELYKWENGLAKPLWPFLRSVPLSELEYDASYYFPI